jgi:peptidyl-prolyl cis-trans isomerase B (cyclophilin B)
MIEMTIKGYGTIALRLEPTQAPNTVANFVALARKGFYDGLIFHRIIRHFMIQGGDPTGTGTSGPGYQIKGEFTANGVKNTLRHKRGTISMARAQSFDSAGSQFFICDADDFFLDGQYAAFGEVTDGLAVLDKIAAAPKDSEDRPLKPIIIEKVVVIDEPVIEPNRLPE